MCCLLDLLFLAWTLQSVPCYPATRIWSRRSRRYPDRPRFLQPVLPVHCVCELVISCIYCADGSLSSVSVCGSGCDLFAVQSSILSVALEWVRPIRHWKTESDLWHHPRQYVVPLVMLLLGAFVGTWTITIWIWSAILLVECCVLLYLTRRL